MNENMKKFLLTKILTHEMNFHIYIYMNFHTYKYFYKLAKMRMYINKSFTL
jgi:hypothetical protein